MALLGPCLGAVVRAWRDCVNARLPEPFMLHLHPYGCHVPVWGWLCCAVTQRRTRVSIRIVFSLTSPGGAAHSHRRRCRTPVRTASTARRLMV